MDPRDFQQLASILSKGKRPAEVRTAISRAYYAAFNVGVELLQNMGFTILKSSAAHGEVLNHLGNSGDDDIKEASVKLGDLSSMRIKADYRLEYTWIETPKTAKAWVKQAKNVIDTLDTSCTGEKREQIIKAIKDWKQKFSR